MVIIPTLAPVAAITSAASEAAASDPVSWLVNYGVAGVIILLLVTGQLRTKAEVAGLEKRVAEQNEAARAKDLAMAALMKQLTDFLPQFAKMGEVVEAIPKNPEVQLLERLESLAGRLDEIQRESGR